MRTEDDFKRAEEDLKNELAQQYRKDLRSPEGRWLQATCRRRARDWLSMREGEVRCAAKELLKPPHKIDAAKFAQLTDQGLSSTARKRSFVTVASMSFPMN